MSVVSTRPEIIKMAPVIREIKKRGIEHVFVATGQHYDFLLFEKILDDLELDPPDYNLEIGSGTPGLHIGLGMLMLERVIEKEKPDIVLAQGDTDSVLAAALAAHKNHYLFGHVEAGLRNYDFWMPEESNRRLTDHISNYLFAPTELSKENLVKENIPEERIFVTGNTVVDAVLQNLPIAERKSRIMNEIPFGPKEYVLITYHRAENTTKDRLKKFIHVLRELSRLGHKMIYPMHPRTKNLLRIYELSKEIENIDNLLLLDPLGYLNFLILMKNAKVILTDSGGLQEEGTVLKVPVLVMRESTERPEALGKGCELVDMNTEKIVNLVNNPPEVNGTPFGDGRAAERIVDIIKSHYIT